MQVRVTVFSSQGGGHHAVVSYPKVRPVCTKGEVFHLEAVVDDDDQNRREQQIQVLLERARQEARRRGIGHVANLDLGP